MDRDQIWVYVSGPYTQGDSVINTREAVFAGHRLRKAGLVAVVPHLSHLAHLIDPQDYRFWMKWDLALLARCDAIVRLPGESPGADEEISAAETMGIPVFTSTSVAIREAKAGMIQPRWKP